MFNQSVEDETVPPNWQELVNRMLSAVETNNAAIADLYTKFETLSPSKGAGNSFTPIRENSRGESLLNVIEKSAGRLSMRFCRKVSSYKTSLSHSEMKANIFIIEDTSGVSNNPPVPA